MMGSEHRLEATIRTGSRELSFAPADAEASQRTGGGFAAFLFGRFRLLIRSRELLLDGVAIPLGSRAIDVLFMLVESRGQLVTKDQLLSGVWRNAAVEENCLQFQVSRLRKALGEERGFIKTVARGGYRFVAEVTVAADPAARPPRDAGAPAADLERRTIALVRSSNIPRPASELIGRDEHLTDAMALLEANRLVTLAGPGGVGKTRLALELAWRLLPTFEGRVWVVELEQAPDPRQVVGAAASALGQDRQAKDVDDLAAVLDARPALLIIDNCEHVIDEAARFAERLLQTCAGLRIVATTREPLRADGEWVYRVPPLAAPPEAAEDLDEVLRHSAAKLFVVRLCAAEAGLVMDRRLARAATRICRRLDGLPLAIELAAASAAVLGAEGLVARLDDPLNLPAPGRRTAPPRHQSLRATFDWSYGLLPEPERMVLRRLAMLKNDFTLEAAVSVAADRDDDVSDIPLRVTNLVAKSLIVRNADDPTPRYRLPQTILACAAEKLVENGEFAALSRFHA